MLNLKKWLKLSIACLTGAIVLSACTAYVQPSRGYYYNGYYHGGYYRNYHYGYGPYYHHRYWRNGYYR